MPPLPTPHLKQLLTMACSRAKNCPALPPHPSPEAVVDDGVQQGEELEAVLGEVLKVARDHAQCHLQRGGGGGALQSCAMWAYHPFPSSVTYQRWAECHHSSSPKSPTSKTASKMRGTSLSTSALSLLMMAANRESTSASLRGGGGAHV